MSVKFDNIVIKNYEWVGNNILNFEIEPTDELIKIADKLREKEGNTDFPGDPCNEVWYNFYLDVDMEHEDVHIWVSANNSEKDDFVSYEIYTDVIDKKKLLWKAFRQYIKESEE